MIVTLLTDFGTRDHFVAAMKGEVLRRAPGATLVDITHEVPPQDTGVASFLLLAAYPSFPPKTVHVAVVDPGVGSARRPIVVAAGGYLFVGPDNGLFGPVLDREPGARVFLLQNPRHFRHPLSSTFHGRDIFAPVAGALASGVAPEEMGPAVDDPVRVESPPVVRTSGGSIHGAVLHVDRFGNCITNLTPDDLPRPLAAQGFRLRVGAAEVRDLRRFYDGAPQGEPFAIWGSAGFLEISINRASAAERLGVERGTPVVLEPG